MADEVEVPEVHEPGFPLNRIVAFAGPYIAVLSGALADWALVHVHFLSLFHTTHDQLASAITQVTVFAVTALITFAMHHKWLDGWQKWETNVVAPAAAASAAPAGIAYSGPDNAPDGADLDYDPDEHAIPESGAPQGKAGE